MNISVPYKSLPKHPARTTKEKQSESDSCNHGHAAGGMAYFFNKQKFFGSNK
jgi:hypothetical protein